MEFLTAIEMAYIHREAYAGLIRGATRGGRGERARLARRAGITPQHLSLVLALDEQDTCPLERWPSPEVAERLCRHLPLPVELRRQALYHMQEALRLRDARACGQVSGGPRSGQSARNVRVLTHEATHARDPAAARRLYRLAALEGKAVLSGLSPWDQPLDFMEVCLCLQDVLGALDRHAEALVYARQGDRLMQEVERGRLRRVEERRRQVEVNLLRALGRSYIGLGLPKKALVHFGRAREAPDSRERPGEWVTHMARDQLAAWVREPRLSISHMERLVRQAEDTVPEARRGVTFLLLRTKLAECYIASGDKKGKAGRILVPIMEAAARLPLGLLHRVMMYRTYALYRRSQGDMADFQQWGHRALDLARQAGLRHQVRTIREYGVGVG